MTSGPGQWGQAASRASYTNQNGRSWFVVGFLLLWVGMLWVLPNGGGNGIALVVGASLLAMITLPLEYAAVAATTPVLLPMLFGGLPPWYMATFRWPFLIAAAAIVIFRGMTPGTPRSGVAWSPFVAALSAFVAVSAFSGINSISPSLSLSKWCILLCALFSAGVAGAKVVEVHGGLAARKWVRAWIVCLSPVVAINILALLTGLGGEIYAQGAFRGLSGNSNSLAAVFSVILPFFVCAFIYRRRKPDTRVWLLSVLALGSIFVLTQSWSRASIAAFGGGLLAAWWIHPRNRLTRYMAVAGMAALMFMVFSPYAGDRFEYWLYKGRENDSLLTARTEQWKRGIEAFQANPILGSGFGITSTREETWSLDSFEMLKAEQGSSFFAILGQTGIMGVVPFYAAVLISLFGATGFAKAVKDPWLTGVVSSCWAAFINSFFEGWMAAPSSGLFWFLMFQLFFLNALTQKLRIPRRVAYPPRPAFAGASARFAPAAGTSAIRGLPRS